MTNEELYNALKESLQDDIEYVLTNDPDRDAIGNLARVAKRFARGELEKILPDNQDLTNGWKYECERYIKERIKSLQ